MLFQFNRNRATKHIGQKLVSLPYAQTSAGVFMTSNTLVASFIQTENQL